MKSEMKKSFIKTLGATLLFFLFITMSGVAHASYHYVFELTAVEATASDLVFDIPAATLEFDSPSLMGPTEIWSWGSSDYIDTLTLDTPININGLEINTIEIGGSGTTGGELSYIQFYFQTDNPSKDYGALVSITTRISFDPDDQSYGVGVFELFPTGYTYTRGDSGGGAVYNFVDISTLTITQNAVPVPGAIWLMGSGLMGIVALRRKNQRN